MMIGQELYDATKAYQSFSRRLRKNGGGEGTPQLRQEWLTIVRRLHEASEQALGAVLEEAK